MDSGTESSQPGPDKYTYTPLADSNSIRVLVLHPAPHLDDAIHVTLEETPLPRVKEISSVLLAERSIERGSPSSLWAATSGFFRPESSSWYSAVSYVWGAPSGDRVIYCHGSVLRVTPNCEALLRHMRRGLGHGSDCHRRRRLWVDAICIDQTSNQEKASQVAIMGLIYHLARRVLIWLGPEAEGLRDVFRASRRVSKILSWTDSAVVQRFKPVRNWYDRKCTSLVARLESLAQAKSCDLVALLNHPWFERVWTTQEQALAASSQFVSRGGFKYTEFDLLGLEATSLPHENRTLYDNRSSLVFGFRSALLRGSPGGRGSITRFLISATVNKATNPRDKVYGLLSMLALIHPLLRDFDVDYDEPVGSTFARFFKTVIVAERTLDVMLTVHPRGEKRDIPSWVFASEPSKPPELIGIPAQSASGESIVDASLLNSPHDPEVRQLKVRGRRLGSITLLPAALPDFRSQNPEETWANMSKLQHVFQTSGWDGDALTLKDALEYLGEKSRQGSFLADTGSLFGTTSAHIGISRFGVEMGDTLVLLAGCAHPVILRPLKRPGTFLWMGYCLVYGLMEGEEWDNSWTPDNLEILTIE